MINLITDLISFTQPTNLDRESLSVIESIAKLKNKVNECIESFNNLEIKTDNDYKKFIKQLNIYKTEILKQFEKLEKDNKDFKSQFSDLIEDLKTFDITLEYIKTQSKFIQDLAKKNQDEIDKGTIATKDDINHVNDTINELSYQNLILNPGIGLGGREPSVFKIELIKNYGFKHFRLSLLWEDIETVKGVYNFSKYDTMIMELINNNITPVIAFLYDNPLYCSSKNIVTAEQRAAFIKYVIATVNKYKQYNVKWEIWNEPNNPGFWNDQINAPYYYTLLVKECYKAIKEIDIKNPVVTCALSNTYRPEDGTPFRVTPFFVECCKLGILDYTDRIGIHPYTVQKPEDLGVIFNAYKSIMHHYSKKDIKIDVSEFGYPMTPKWDGVTMRPFTLGENVKAQYTLRTMLVNLMYGVTSSTIHEYYAPQNDEGNSEDWFGIFNKDYTPTITATTVKEFFSSLGANSKLLYWQNPNTSDYMLYFVQDEENNKYCCVYWTTINEHTLTINNKEYTFTNLPQIKPLVKSDLDNSISKEELLKSISGDGALEYAYNLPGYRNNNGGETFTDYTFSYANYNSTSIGMYNTAFPSSYYECSKISDKVIQLTKSITGLKIGDEIFLKTKWNATGNYTVTSIDNDKLQITVNKRVNDNVICLFYKADNDTSQASFVEGANNISCGYGSHAEGVGTLATQESNHSEGRSTKATGLHTHAEGNNSVASGDYSHSEGKDTQAIGKLSHAQNNNTLASGHSSHAEGNSTVASGINSHSQGYNSIASGDNSFASGDSTKASGLNSSTFGEGTLSTVKDQFIIGRYNENKNDTVLEIGRGDDKDNRKNALEVLIGSSNIVLYSPDGSRWKITINNEGTLNTEKI